MTQCFFSRYNLSKQNISLKINLKNGKESLIISIIAKSTNLQTLIHSTDDKSILSLSKYQNQMAKQSNDQD